MQLSKNEKKMQSKPSYNIYERKVDMLGCHLIKWIKVCSTITIKVIKSSLLFLAS